MDYKGDTNKENSFFAEMGILISGAFLLKISIKKLQENIRIRLMNARMFTNQNQSKMTFSIRHYWICM